MSFIRKGKTSRFYRFLVFKAHMNILFIIKVNIFMLMKWSYRSSQICWVLNLEWLSYFEHVVQSLEYISLCYPFLEPHPITYHLILGVQFKMSSRIRHVYLKGDLTPGSCRVWNSQSVWETLLSLHLLMPSAQL